MTSAPALAVEARRRREPCAPPAGSTLGSADASTPRAWRTASWMEMLAGLAEADRSSRASEATGLGCCGCCCC